MKIKTVLLIIAAVLSASMTFSQNKPWKEQGNNANNSPKLGTTNNKSLKIITNDQLRMEVMSDGKVIVKDSMQVEGTIKADSLFVNNGAHIKGPLHVGDNSITIDATVFGSDEITSDNGEIVFGNTGPPNYLFEEIKVGIGTQFPLSTAPLLGVYGLEVNNDINLSSSVLGHGYRIGGVVVLQKPLENSLLIIKKTLL